MTGSQTILMRHLISVALVLLGGHPFAQSTPSPPSILSSSSRGPPTLPQYYATSSHRPPSVAPPYPVSSLAPTSPVYTAQRIRSSDSYRENSPYSDDPYPVPASSNLELGLGKSPQDYEDTQVNTGFVEPIDFGGLLKDIGSSPKATNLDIQSGQTSPLFASESKDTFQGFFGSTKNPFEELSRLHTASSDHNSRQQGNDEDNIGFVDPNVQFRSLFDSAGTSSSTGFGPSDFLGSKSENLGSAPSKGSQTRAYPSFTYTGRGNERDREEEDYPRDEGSNRYRSSYRQVNGGGDNSNNDYHPSSNNPQPHNTPDHYQQTNRGGRYDDYDGNSNNSPSTDSYDDYDGRGPSYVASPATGRRGQSNDRPTPRYSSHAAQETAQSPQSKPRTAASESSKNPKCKKVEKSVDYGDDHASFTEPDADYDPSTYRGRYKRQARQRGRSNGQAKRPMTCYVCEDEHGRYAEKCSYDSKGSPNKNGNYYHSESSSFSDNGRSRPSQGKSRSKDRHRRNSSNRQRYSAGGSSEDATGSESTTKKVYVPAEIAESEAKVVGKRQSGNYYGGGGGGGGGGRPRNPHHQQNRDEYGDPYDGSTGSYSHPSGYEGPPLGSVGDTSGDDGHGYGRGGGGGGGRDGGHSNSGYDSDFDYESAPDYEKEAAQATREYDFSIPREFDPDVQLRPGGGNNNNNNNFQRREGSPQEGGPSEATDFQFYPNPNQAFRPSPRDLGSSGLHQSASNRQDKLDDFDVGYNDYIRQNFPEAFNSPGFSAPSDSPRNHEFSPNYYHRPRSGNNNQDGGYNQDRDRGHGQQDRGYSHQDGGGYNQPRRGYNDRRQSPEVSYSPSDNSHRGYERDRPGQGRGHYAPVKENTQPSYNFSPPPGFFPEDSPSETEEGNLGNILKEFSTRTRDGCRRVNKGDMTCYVCRDAKGANKEECMYASNDPKNKAMAYHEVTEYSSPMGRFLPAPLHASLLGLGLSEKIEGEDDHIPAKSGTDESTGTTASSPLASASNVFSKQELKGSPIIPSLDSKHKSLLPIKKGKGRDSLESASSSISAIEDSRKTDETTEKVTKKQKRSKRSPIKLSGPIRSIPKEYDFDY